MVGKIGSSRFELLGGGDTSRTLGSALTVRSSSSARSGATDDAATVSLSSTTSSSKTSSAPGVSNYLSVRENAVSEVAALRAEQKALADKGATLAEGSELSKLQTRFSEIETEVTRISSEATYQGKNVLSGATFGENDNSDTTETKVFSVSNLSPLTASTGLSLSSPEQADAASDALTVLVGLTSTAAESSSRAQDVATSSAASSSDAPSEDAQPLSVEESRKVALSIGAQVTQSASYSAEDSTLSLISSLDQRA